MLAYKCASVQVVSVLVYACARSSMGVRVTDASPPFADALANSPAGCTSWYYHAHVSVTAMYPTLFLFLPLIRAHALSLAFSLFLALSALDRSRSISPARPLLSRCSPITLCSLLCLTLSLSFLRTPLPPSRLILVFHQPPTHEPRAMSPSQRAYTNEAP